MRGAFIGVQMRLPMQHSVLGVAVLLGFTFFMGLMFTPILTRTLGYSNGGTLNQ